MRSAFLLQHFTPLRSKRNRPIRWCQRSPSLTMTRRCVRRTHHRQHHTAPLQKTNPLQLVSRARRGDRVRVPSAAARNVAGGLSGRNRRSRGCLQSGLRADAFCSGCVLRSLADRRTLSYRQPCPLLSGVNTCKQAGTNGLALRAISFTFVHIRCFSCSNFCGARSDDRKRKWLILYWWAV